MTNIVPLSPKDSRKERIINIKHRLPKPSVIQKIVVDKWGDEWKTTKAYNLIRNTVYGNSLDHVELIELLEQIANELETKNK